MLNQFTWQEFITAVLMAGIAYYAIASILLFHKEIIAFFKAKPTPPTHADIEPTPVVTAFVSERVSSFAPASASVSFPIEPPVTNISSEEQDDVVEVVSPEAAEYGYSGEELPEEKQPPLEIVVEEEPDNSTSQGTPLIIGVISDLLSEMKSLFLVCAENKTARLEVLRFIRLLLRRYVSLYQSEHKDSITLYIYHTWNEHLSHPVDPIELAQCWLPNKPE